MLFEGLINWLKVYFGGLLRFLSSTLVGAVSGLSEGLLYLPIPVLIAIFAILAWRLAGKKIAIFVGVGLLFCYALNLWTETIQTLALVIVAVIMALAIGILLGILSGVNNRAWSIFRPIVDFMQTMPAYVYFVPAIALFGLGIAPAVVAALIFALPPALRLTNVGIREVPRELVEVGQAFGATGRQTLTKIQLPSALPSIMVGVNQCIMFALSMAVITGWLTAPGLGLLVWHSILYLKVGKGLEGGLAIVIMAMILDRVTAACGRKFERGFPKLEIHRMRFWKNPEKS
jgi:glycine betaine/proline transport system permease protein